MQKALVEEIAETLRVTPDQPEFQTLLSWPVSLAHAWSKTKESLRPTVLDAESVRIGRQAESAVEALPFRLEISSTACRQSGLTEDQIDAVKWIVNEAFETLPRTVLVIGGLVKTSGIGHAEVMAPTSP